MQSCGKTPGQARSEPRPRPDRARATHAKSRPQHSAGWLLGTPNRHMPGSHRHPKTHPHAVPRTGPQWGKSLREQGPGRESGVTPPPSPGATGLHPAQAALCRTRQTRGDPHTPKSPPARSSRSGRGAGGGPLTSLTVSAPRKQSSRGASPGTHSTARRRAATRSGAGRPEPGMNGAPLPHGGARGAAASPTSPRGGRQRGPGGKWSASPNLPAASHSPKQRSPPTRRHFGERPPRGIVQPAGSAPHPSPSPGDSWGPAPPELRLRAERAGAPSRRPGPPPPEKFAPPPPRARWPGPAHSPRRGQSNLWGAAAPSLPPAGRRRAGPSRGRGGPGAPEQPRAAPGPPPPRRVP